LLPETLSLEALLPETLSLEPKVPEILSLEPKVPEILSLNQWYKKKINNYFSPKIGFFRKNLEKICAIFQSLERNFMFLPHFTEKNNYIMDK
jgi:hypothetical protein